MAGKIGTNTKPNIKRNVQPMYIRSKNISIFDDSTDYNARNPRPSAWNANHDDKTDDKLFLERRDLTGQWYIHWNDTQRKRFLDFILERSTHSQLKFIVGWCKKPIRVQQDFVAVLPRILSTHVLSYLDPRSLCRAASVSWHWKWLADQDIIWKKKCLKYGWYLPYQPSDLENGAWKKHYVMCIQTMNIKLPQKSINSVIESHSKLLEERSERDAKGYTERSSRTWKKIIPLVHKEEPHRPPWVSNSFRPKELEFADNAFFRQTTENKPSPLGDLTKTSQRSRSFNKHPRSKTTPNQLMHHSAGQEQGLIQRSKSEDFSSYTESCNPAKMTLSEAIKMEISDQNGMELRDSGDGHGYRHIVKSPRMDRSEVYSTCESTRNLQDFSSAYPNVANPRFVFISSRIPACELLVNAMSYGVLPIVYDYEGTTLSGLLEQFTSVLIGRKARSVGFFVTGQSGTIDLVRGSSVSLSSLAESDVQKFWQAVSMEILTADEGGHVDIFFPLCGTASGTELLAQLQISTGLIFSSPTGTVSSIFKVDDDWLLVPEDESPPKIYFDGIKLVAWTRVAEYIEESMVEVRSYIYDHFEDELHGLASKVIGQIMFEAFGLLEISEIHNVSKVLVNALVLMMQEKQADKSNATSRLIECLQKCQTDQSRPTRKRAKKDAGRTPREEKESANLNESEQDVNSEEDDSRWQIGDHLMTSNVAGKVALGERRSVIAHEILRSERDYCNTLAIVQNFFRKPLEASVKSNRPVIGTANIRMIFNDSEMLLTISKELIVDLSHRLQEWDSHQCLGDVFLKFNTKLKAYMNFVNNYPITLATIDKCQKQHPSFRGFLLQLERQPCTKLMSLQNLLLAPAKRVEEYVCLLEGFSRRTPSEHKDSQNLEKAIQHLKQLKLLFDEARARDWRERKLRDVQKRIDKCPALVERSRFFIKQEDVILLRRTDTGDVKPEFRVYQNIGNTGLFLFNDCLVVTTKSHTSVPFHRILETSYQYHSTLPLSTVKLEEITDSKYVQNAFIIVTPKRHWICQAKSKQVKTNWLSLLTSSVRTSLK